MTEIQGKSILVRVRKRFELARVRVIGSRLYQTFNKPNNNNNNNNNNNSNNNNFNSNNNTVFYNTSAFEG